ncbi:MAG TPA: hypothetical protein ACQGQH_03735, partial [Xylella sp.]
MNLPAYSNAVSQKHTYESYISLNVDPKSNEKLKNPLPMPSVHHKPNAVHLQYAPQNHFKFKILNSGI